ncbi:DUF6247 family protein [Actinoallomurus spadix]|uniref:Uncharacterized protein n=1 Tax=Actinoallomurus spadix TaxID=79912 RepID=A0ABP3FV61_9ACTN|nr:DUF6247 family protein [Actinoallomurus spadix]MCO5986270.1 DUF6247 family protein [Actinoallomurus spadix]
MTAQPVEQYEDPHDPQVILGDLPRREHPLFLKQYHEAVDAAHDPAGYKRLQAVLRHWSITARALNKALKENPNYYEDLAAEVEGVRNGTVQTVPLDVVIPDRAERVAEERRHRYR